jgi:hypothetical protein
VEHVLSGDWQLKNGQAPLARRTDANQFVSGNLPISNNHRGRRVGTLTILDEPSTPIPLHLTILLSLQMIRRRDRPHTYPQAADACAKSDGNAAHSHSLVDPDRRTPHAGLLLQLV